MSTLNKFKVLAIAVFSMLLFGCTSGKPLKGFLTYLCMFNRTWCAAPDPSPPIIMPKLPALNYHCNNCYVYVTYNPNQSSQGLYGVSAGSLISFNIDESGNESYVSSVPTSASASQILINESGTNAYVINRNDPFIYMYSIESGKLSKLSKESIATVFYYSSSESYDFIPLQLSLSPGESYVYLSGDYGDIHRNVYRGINAYIIDNTGALGYESSIPLDNITYNGFVISPDHYVFAGAGTSIRVYQESMGIFTDTGYENQTPRMDGCGFVLNSSATELYSCWLNNLYVSSIIYESNVNFESGVALESGSGITRTPFLNSIAVDPVQESYLYAVDMANNGIYIFHESDSYTLTLESFGFVSALSPTAIAVHTN